ncbi:MAG TPA: carboxypeptidase-like regulatory domain-containing protein [Pyrinomonadaceae bacterium]|nr:carboxypeptidase-like regulatory domain-containing protein [Pyrinomonadaceae bacterium]
MMERLSSIRYCSFVVALLVCAPHCWAQSSAPKPAATPNRQITGRVVDSAGEPLAGASVSVSSISGNARGKSAIVDDRGDFKVAGLEPGLYAVFASMPGYVGNFPSTAIEGRNYYRVGDSVTLTLTKGGVITGTVTGSNGPLVGLGVFATRVKDAAGKKIFTAIPSGYERRTDDRGVFRFYGLPPGAYILLAMRPRVGTILPSAYDNDVPTFYPSATRDTAAEIVVREGDEITADIQYRGESGHAISGKLSGFISDQLQFGSSPQIALTDIRDRTQIANGAPSLSDPSVFAFYGVPDGEYELSARQYLPTGDQLASAPRRIKVRGTDVTGISLTLAPLAAIAGRLVFEPDPKAGCAMRRETAVQETLVYARRYEPGKKPAADPKAAAPEVPLSAAAYTAQGVGDAKGSFTLRNLPPGSYQIDPRPPASGWYVRSIAIGATQSAARAASIATARDGVAVRSGERVAGLMVTITEGASRLRGRISGTEAQTLPQRLRIYLIPVEPEDAENVLRFYESRIEVDGRFTVDNVAPGKYWIVARPAAENEPGSTKSVRQDTALRAKIFQEAEALKKAVMLKPCEEISDFVLPYVPPASQ